MVRLKYVSRMAIPLSDSDVDEITELAAANNEALEVTGVLFSSGGLFVQVLEGPDQAVESLFDAIAKDPRHRDVLLLERESDVEFRLFPEWSMKRLTVDAEAKERLEPLRAILSTIAEQKKRTELLTHVLEKALLRELSQVIIHSD
jgi:hypothetical protein